MRFSKSETERTQNLKSHAVDFIDAPRVFEGTTFTFEDDRFNYAEQRFVTLELLAGVPYPLSTRRTNMKSASSLSAKPRTVKRKSTSPKSGTDWQHLESKQADDHLIAEHPEAELKHVVHGIVRRGLTPLPTKSSISLRLDQDVLEWFKAQGTGYQTRINAVLRAFRDASTR
jgi:uncharacterized protein (DUF4415 family)